MSDPMSPGRAARWPLWGPLDVPQDDPDPVSLLPPEVRRGVRLGRLGFDDECSMTQEMTYAAR